MTDLTARGAGQAPRPGGADARRASRAAPAAEAERLARGHDSAVQEPPRPLTGRRSSARASRAASRDHEHRATGACRACRAADSAELPPSTSPPRRCRPRCCAARAAAELTVLLTAARHAAAQSRRPDQLSRRAHRAERCGPEGCGAARGARGDRPGGELRVGGGLPAGSHRHDRLSRDAGGRASCAPGFELLLDPKEVEDSFEVPLDYVFDPANHRLQRCAVSGFTGEEVEFCDIPYGERNIWGATAGMLLTLYRLCVGSRRTVSAAGEALRRGCVSADGAAARPRARLSVGPEADLREHRALHDRGGLRGGRCHRARRS